MLYNNQSPYTVALLVPNKEAILGWLSGLGDQSAQLERGRGGLRLLKAEFDAYLAGGKHERLFPERWLPSSFAVLSEPFTEQNRFVNSTLKMVRGRIAKHYRDRIEYLYTIEGRTIENPKNLEALQTLLSG
jgi:long-chain acyl-CoA synthetase